MGLPEAGVLLAELALLAALVVVGARLGSTGPAGIVLAVILPLGAAVFWGFLLAPKAKRRLRGPQ